MVSRAVGTMHPTDNVPVPPDTIITFLMTGGSSAQAADWPSGVEIVRITPQTTAGGAFSAFVCFGSTAAAVPAAGTTQSTAASSGVSCCPVPFQLSYQVPGSTGFSVAAYTSGIVQVECWRK